jgi:formimidoylglutamate deiminase
VLDPDHPVFTGRPLERLLDAYVFSSHGNPVRDVMFGGQWVVRDGRHRDRELVRKRYRQAVDRLR